MQVHVLANAELIGSIKRVTTSLLIDLTAAIATKGAPFLRPSWASFGIH